jgi:hypothetical protein
MRLDLRRGYGKERRTRFVSVPSSNCRAQRGGFVQHCYSRIQCGPLRKERFDLANISHWLIVALVIIHIFVTIYLAS